MGVRAASGMHHRLEGEGCGKAEGAHLARADVVLGAERRRPGEEDHLGFGERRQVGRDLLELLVSEQVRQHVAIHAEEGEVPHGAQ